MIKNRKYLIIALLFFFSCKSTEISVGNINSTEAYGKNYVFYSLPKTKIYISVEVRKIVKSKGPFADYTHKYLGSLKNQVVKNETYWEISSVDFFFSPIRDSSQIYAIYTDADDFYFPLQLTKDGFIISYNTSVKNYELPRFDFKNSGVNDNGNEITSFNLLNSDKTYKVVYDTIYKEEVYDTVIKKVPILKPNLVKKTLDEQAKELADRLTTLADDRAALLVGEGDNDYLPEGDALKLMLDEIDKLEAEYLSLFIGKTDTLTYKYTFSFVPESNDRNKEFVLFRFSQDKGILSADDNAGKPVYLILQTEEYTKKFKQYNSFVESLNVVEKIEVSPGLFYRIPEKSKVGLKIDSQIISEKETYIPQFGTIAYLPASLLKNDNVKIRFYPELGSIKSIEYK